MKKIILIVILFCSISALAQNDSQKIVDEFFKLYKEKGPNGAVEYLFGTNKWMKESTDQIENVKFKLSSAVKLVGDYSGYNLITKKTVGDQLILYTYIIKYDRQPLRFSIMFYKPSNEWRLLNFSFDDSLDDELKDAAKVDRLPEN